MTRTAKLMMVTENNNNKFYEMKQTGTDSFVVSYGRVGATAATQTYPISSWEKKYREKVNKGYTDQTYLFAEAQPSSEFAKISNIQVQSLIDELTAYAQKSIQKNYLVSSDQVTKLQVENAQKIIDQLQILLKIPVKKDVFNALLLDLYKIIPRKMNSVHDYLIGVVKTQKQLDEVHTLLENEQNTLDVMRGQVEINEKKKNQNANQKNDILLPAQTILDAMGLEITTIEDTQTIDQLKKMMTDKAHLFVRAYSIRNIRTQKAFDTRVLSAKNKTHRLYWHGSRSENWLSILEKGLVLRPSNAVITGKMFGDGLYFADRCQKSLNYTSMEGSYWANGHEKKGFLALYDVHVGSMFSVKKHESWCSRLNAKELEKKGDSYDSVFAEKGYDLHNNEFIVYNETQCTIQCLIEVAEPKHATALRLVK